MSFWNFRFSKIPQKIWQISALESEKWSNHKIKALYNVFNTLDNKFDHIYYKKVSLSYDLTPFTVLGQKSVKFFGGFLENLKFPKDILKLSDL